MTEIILKPNEFIIKLDGDADEIILNELPVKIQLVNPHKELEFDSNAHLLLKEALMLLKTILDKLP